jgi:DNA-binding transcriptional MerR regulator
LTFVVRSIIIDDVLTLRDIQNQNQRLSLDEFVRTANLLLPRYWPEDAGAKQERDARLREGVSARLVRHLTTLGLLEEPLREGREARYMPRHLLQLLVARRLMAEGYTTGAVKKLTAGTDDMQLESLLQGGAQLAVEASRPTDPTLMGSGPFEPMPIVSASVEPSAVGSSEPPASRKAENDASAFLRRVREREGKVGAISPAPGASAPHATPAPVVRPATPFVRPPRWIHLEILPGLEVQVREDFILPSTPHERDRLLQLLWEQLKEQLKAAKGRSR